MPHGTVADAVGPDGHEGKGHADVSPADAYNPAMKSPNQLPERNALRRSVNYSFSFHLSECLQEGAAGASLISTLAEAFGLWSWCVILGVYLPLLAPASHVLDTPPDVFQQSAASVP